MLHSNFTNVKYSLVRYWVICAKDNKSWVNLVCGNVFLTICRWLKIAFAILINFKMLFSKSALKKPSLFMKDFRSIYSVLLFNKIYHADIFDTIMALIFGIIQESQLFCLSLLLSLWRINLIGRGNPPLGFPLINQKR